ncbi:DUF4209 domain-containing protein [Enterobacter kobei]|nr:DUF4209 domain-containing protein [Enterobacter kobei]
MQLDKIEVTVEGFSCSELKEIFANKGLMLGHDFEMVFSKYPENKEISLLGAICSMRLDSSNVKAPFKAKFVSADRRGFLPEDFAHEQLTVLNDVFEGIGTPEVRARVADLLWVRKIGGIKNAHAAIESYIESAYYLAEVDASWPYIFERLERALRLSAAYRREKQNPEFFVRSSEALLREYEKSLERGEYIYNLKLLALIQDLDVRDVEWVYQQAEDLASLCKMENDFYRAIDSYDIAIISAIRGRDKTKEHQCWRAISECYVTIAELETPGLVSSGHLLKAIEALAKVPNTKKERLEIYEEMRDHQVESLNQMGSFVSEGQDISELRKDAIEKVQGLDGFDALFRLATVSRPVDMDRLKQEAQKIMKSSFSWMFGVIHIDHQGIPTAKAPSTSFENISDTEQCWPQMIQNIQISHQISIEAQILPALQYINEHFYIPYSLLETVCRNHPFIPAGHEPFFINGLLAGIERDFMTACHLLIPQVENSLRFLVQQSGEEPTTLHGDGTQERDGLKTMLEHPAIIERLGVNLTSNLKIILLDKFYGDLRNQLAHGYTPASHYQGVSAVYFWWLMLFMVMAPYAEYWKRAYNSQGTPLVGVGIKTNDD